MQHSAVEVFLIERVNKSRFSARDERRSNERIREIKREREGQRTPARGESERVCARAAAGQ